MAPQVGLEPTTLRLTAGCSAIELLRSVATRPRRGVHKLSISIISSGVAAENFTLLRDNPGPQTLEPPRAPALHILSG